MKNQYIGDIGDFGKYGLLRFLQASGIRTGVNWYLTPDDGRTDGVHIEYLNDARMSAYDPELYDAMKQIAPRKDKSIKMLEREACLSGMCFYDVMMDFSGLSWRERTGARMKWHDGAMSELGNAQLVFADPDNGLSVNQKPTNKNAEKYVLPSEIVGYYNQGQQVLYYQHRSRKAEDEWLEQKRQIKTYLPNAQLLALSFHRWSARTYIFVLHGNRLTQYTELLRAFINTAWGTHGIDGKVPFTYDCI